MTKSAFIRGDGEANKIDKNLWLDVAHDVGGKATQTNVNESTVKCVSGDNAIDTK